MKLLGKIITIGFFLCAAHSLPAPTDLDIYFYLGRITGALFIAFIVIWIFSEHHKLPKFIAKGFLLEQDQKRDTEKENTEDDTQGDGPDGEETSHNLKIKDDDENKD